MGDTLELFRPLCNGSVRVESGTEKLTGDAGFLLLREALDRTALIEPLAAQLEDPRDQRRITHSLPSPLRANVAMIAQGWGDCVFRGIPATDSTASRPPIPGQSGH
jgi:hypothetical protein